MFSFSWNPAWDIGNPEIDRQHHELFLRMGNLAAAIEGGSPFAELERTLLHLGDYIESHFTMEEGLMAGSSYPGLDQHKAAHDALRRRVQALVDDYLGGRQELQMELMDFLVAWLVEHLGGEDRLLAAHLHTKTLAQAGKLQQT